MAKYLVFSFCFWREFVNFQEANQKPNAMMNEPLSSIMTANLITVQPSDKLTAVQHILTTKRIHHVPVVEGKRLVGLLTTYDLFKLCRSGEDYDQIEVRDVMTTRLATLEPEDKVGSASEVFLENLFHAIPIVKDDELVGIVTTLDVLRYSYEKEYPRQVSVA